MLNQMNYLYFRITALFAQHRLFTERHEFLIRHSISRTLYPHGFSNIIIINHRITPDRICLCLIKNEYFIREIFRS